MCPMCKKVVEFGVVCDNCAAWFHATESCCGDALADAFLRTGKGPWCCPNCFPHVGERPVADRLMAPAATAEVLDWRRAFHIFTESCAGCGLQVKGEGEGQLRCAECYLPFHSRPGCTGLSEEKIRGRATGDWCCPTCTLTRTRTRTRALTQTLTRTLTRTRTRTVPLSNLSPTRRASRSPTLAVLRSCPTCTLRRTGTTVPNSLVG